MADFLPYLGNVLTGIASADDAAQRQILDGILQVGAQQAWSAAHDQVVDGIRAQIGRADGIGPGWTLHNDFELDLARDVQLKRLEGSTSAAGAIPMRLQIAPNLLKGATTTPSVFGSDFDPEFSLDFGIVVDFSVSVVPEQLLMQVNVDAAHITGADGTGDPKLDSQNLVGDLIKGFFDVFLPFFGGPRYRDIVQAQIAQHDFAGVLNQAIVPLNNALANLAKDGFGSIVALFPDAGVPSGLSPKSIGLGGQRPIEATPLLVIATKVIGNGTISGAVRWPMTDGQPALDPPFVGAFTISATLAGPGGGVADGQFRVPIDVTHLARWASDDTDDEHVVRYELTGLPIDRPIEVEGGVTGTVPWTDAAMGMQHTLDRDGWAGLITIRKALEVRTGTVGALDRARIGAAGIAQQVSLNPQPIPPGAGIRRPGLAAEVALNPQPIPPGDEFDIGRAGLDARVAGGGVAGLKVERETPIGIADREKFVVEQAIRQDPTGPGMVTNIDFKVTPFRLR